MVGTAFQGFLFNIRPGKKNTVFGLVDGVWQENDGLFQLGGDGAVSFSVTIDHDPNTDGAPQTLMVTSIDGLSIGDRLLDGRILTHGLTFDILGGKATATLTAAGQITITNLSATMAELGALQFGFEDASHFDAQNGVRTLFVDQAEALQDQRYLITTLRDGQSFSAVALTQQDDPVGALQTLNGSAPLVIDGRGSFELIGGEVWYTASRLPNNVNQTRVEVQVTRDGAVEDRFEVQADKIDSTFGFAQDVNTAPVAMGDGGVNLSLFAGQTVSVDLGDLIGLAHDAEGDALELGAVSFGEAPGLSAVLTDADVLIEAQAGAGGARLPVSYSYSDGTLESAEATAEVVVVSGYAGSSFTPTVSLVMAPMAHMGASAGHDVGQGGGGLFLPVGDGSTDLNGDGTPDTVLPSQQSVQSGDWFDPLTWGGTAGDYSVIPTDAALVHIQNQHSVTYDLGTPGAGSHYEQFLGHWHGVLSRAVADGDLTDLPVSLREAFETQGGLSFGYVPDLFIVRVDGALEVSAENGADTRMVVDTLVSTTGGTMGQSTLSILAEDETDGTIDIAIRPLDMSQHAAVLPDHYRDLGSFEDGAGVLGRYGWDPEQLSLGLVAQGAVTVAGQAKTHHLSTDDHIAAGDTDIRFATDLRQEGWAVGDVISVSTTARHSDFRDRDYEAQNEVLRITGLSSDGSTITFERVEDGATALKFDHNHDAHQTTLGAATADSIETLLGEAYADRAGDFEIDIINLSRNVNIRSWAATQEADQVAQGASFGTADPGAAHWVSEQGHVMLMHTDDVSISHAGFLGLGRTDKALPTDDLPITGLRSFVLDDGTVVENAVLGDVALLAQVLGVLNAAEPNWAVSTAGFDLEKVLSTEVDGAGTTVRDQIDALADLGPATVSRHFSEAWALDLAKEFTKQEFDLDGTAAPEDMINPRGRYSLHLHQTGTGADADGSTLVGNVVWGSPGWGYAQHDSVADLTNNVSFDVFGSAFNTETGNERGTWTGNVAMQTGFPRVWAAQNREDDFAEALHDFGFSGSGFWLAGHAVEMVGNTSIDASTAGFWIDTNGAFSVPVTLSDLGDVPDGLEQMADANGQLDAQDVPFLTFVGNRSVSTNYGIYWSGDADHGTLEERRKESGLFHTIEDFTSIATQQYLLYAFGVADLRVIDPISFGGAWMQTADGGYTLGLGTTLVNSQHDSSDFTVIGGYGYRAGSFFSHSSDTLGQEDYGHTIVVRDGATVPQIREQYRADTAERLEAEGDLRGKVASVETGTYRFDKLVITLKNGETVVLEGEDILPQDSNGLRRQADTVQIDGETSTQYLSVTEYTAVMPVQVLQESALGTGFRVMLGQQSDEAAYSYAADSYDSTDPGAGGSVYGYDFQSFAAGKIRRIESVVRNLLERKIGTEEAHAGFDIAGVTFHSGSDLSFTHAALMEALSAQYVSLLSRIKAVEESYVFDFDAGTQTDLHLYGMVEDSLGATYTDFLGAGAGDSTGLAYRLSSDALAHAARENGYVTIGDDTQSADFIIVSDVFRDRYSNEAHEVTFLVRLMAQDAAAEAVLLAGADHLGRFGALAFDSAAQAHLLDDTVTVDAGGAFFANFGADHLTGDDGANLLSGGDGDDTLDGGGGDDVLIGGYGADTFVIGTGGTTTIRDFHGGEDVIDLSAWGMDDPDDLVITLVQSGEMRLTYGTQSLTVLGAWGADVPLPESGSFVLAAPDDPSGDDLLILQASAGAEIFALSAETVSVRILDFNPDEDSVDLSGWGVTDFDGLALLVEGETRVVAGFADQSVAFEGFGTADLDRFTPQVFGFEPEPTPPVVVSGTSGKDRIDPNYVDADGDRLDDSGQRIETGDGDQDHVYDGAGDDTVVGGSGRDIFFAGDGADVYIGGGNRDEVNYGLSALGLTVDMTDPTRSTGIASGDSFDSIERLHGTAFDDVLVGAGETELYGRDGDDLLIDSTLHGKARLSGGSGADTFRLVVDGELDRILDFRPFTEGDRLDLTLWGVSDLSDLSITQDTNGQGILQNRSTLRYEDGQGTQEALRLDNITMDEIALLTQDHFLFV